MKTSKSRESDPKQIFLGFILLAFLAVAAFFVVSLFWQAFTALQPPIAAAIIAGSATVLVSVISLILSKQWELRREIEQEHRRQKLPIYEEFMTFWFKQFGAQKDGITPASQKEILGFTRGFTQKLIVWGSDIVLVEYAAFRRQALSAKEAPPTSAILSLLAFEKLLYAIRADIGHRNKGLRSGDLLSLFITDIDEHLRAGTTLRKSI